MGEMPMRDRRRKGTSPGQRRHCGYTREGLAGMLTPEPEDLPVEEYCHWQKPCAGRLKRAHEIQTVRPKCTALSVGAYLLCVEQTGYALFLWRAATK